MPEIQALRPMSTSQVLDRTFSLYRRNFILFAGIAALPPALVLAGELLLLFVAKPFSVPGRAPGGISPSGMDQSITAAAMMGLGSIVIFVLWLVGYAMAAGASVHAVSRVHLGHPTGIGESYRLIRPHIGAILGIVIIVFLCLVGVVVLGFTIFVIPVMLFKFGSISMGDPTAAAGAIFLGLLVSLVAGGFALFLFAKFFLTVPACVLENLGVVESLKRSWSLTSGSVGRIILVIVLTVVIDGAVSGILSIPYVIGIALMVTKKDPSLLFPFVVWQYVANFLSKTLANPIASISAALIYYDQRVRKEAFDLQLMMEAIGSAPPPAPATAAYPSVG